MRKRLNNGFTLLEIVIVAGMAMIIGTVLAGILVNNTGVFYQQNSIVKSGLNVNDLLQTLSANISEASSIASGYPEATPVYISSANTLVLKFASLDANGVISSTYDYVVIYKDPQDPNVLRMQTFANPLSTRRSGSQVLTTLLEGISYKYLDKSGLEVVPTASSSIQVTVEALLKQGSIGQKQTSSVIVNLRNL